MMKIVVDTLDSMDFHLNWNLLELHSVSHRGLRLVTAESEAVSTKRMQKTGKFSLKCNFHLDLWK